MKHRSVFQSATLTDVAMCVNHYRLSTPGLFVCVHVGVPLAALEERDWWGVMARISQGVTRRGHRDFMATIWKK